MLNARSSKNESIILQRLGEEGQVHAANALNVDESTISRMKSKMGEFADLLAFLNLKVVPDVWVCMDKETVRVLKHGHQQWTEMIEKQEELLWDDPE